MLNAGIDADWINVEDNDDQRTPLTAQSEAFIGIRASHEFGLSMMMDEEEWMDTNDSRQELERYNPEHKETAGTPMLPVAYPKESESGDRSPIVAEESAPMPSLMEDLELEDEDCEEVCLL